MKKNGMLILLVVGALCAPVVRAKTGEKPNIIFLLTDDQRWNTLGCNGNEVIKTPNIDSLARDGVNFRNMFASTPICVVSRASILSGQYMRTHGIRDFEKPFTPEQMEMTYPAILRRNGYFTGFTGKWGVGASLYEYDMYKDRFDFWRGQPGQDEYWRDGKNGRHQNVRMADDTDDFLAQAKRSGKPFCLSVSFKAPHGPWDGCQPEIFAAIRQEDIPVVKTFTKEAWEAQPDFIKHSIPGYEAAVGRDWMFNKKSTVQYKHLIAQYYALIEGVDVAVGRIRASLEKYGFADNTILIYTSDNGHFLYDKGLIGKWLLYEQSLRLPMVVYDPFLPKGDRGKIRNEDVLNVDIAPTILSLAGVNVPKRMEGRDLSPLLRGEHPAWRREAFFEHTFSETGRRTIPKSIGVRSDEWKYIRYISERPPCEQLFNLERDPDELNNLATSPEYREQLDKMRAECDAMRFEIKDNYPDYEEYPDRYVVSVTGRIHPNNPVQFTHVKSLGQTFPAETSHLTCVELMMPTWGEDKKEAPCDVKAELLQNGRLLKTLTIKKENIHNIRRQRLMFETPVEKGAELYLRLVPTGSVPPQQIAWWAYDKPIYSGGTAFVNDRPQNYSHELRMVFRK